MSVRLFMAFILVVGIGISACGKKGPLEPPKSSAGQISSAASPA